MLSPLIAHKVGACLKGQPRGEKNNNSLWPEEGAGGDPSLVMSHPASTSSSRLGLLAQLPPVCTQCVRRPLQLPHVQYRQTKVACSRLAVQATLALPVLRWIWGAEWAALCGPTDWSFRIKCWSCCCCSAPYSSSHTPSSVSWLPNMCRFQQLLSCWPYWNSTFLELLKLAMILIRWYVLIASKMVVWSFSQMVTSTVATHLKRYEITSKLEYLAH
jgi:hypothetical protein